MQQIKYNPETEPLAPIISQVELGNEVETPVFSQGEGEYIRQRLSNLFKTISDSYYLMTGMKWPRPIPHLVKENWELDMEDGSKLSGEWKIKVDWVRKTRKKVVYFNRVE